jgi:uncharacterized protein YajQ (UPF0234 family)
MPSFDIVSQVNSMEIENAVYIAKKELANRFDFRGAKAEIVLERKLTTQIQNRQVRVTGRSRDDLQAVIAAVRAKDFPVALQFTDFRD